MTTTQGLLATCCLDRTIHLWGIENLAPRGSMVGHKLGVRALAYASSHTRRESEDSRVPFIFAIKKHPASVLN